MNSSRPGKKISGLLKSKPEYAPAGSTRLVCLNGIEPSHMASEATALSAELQALIYYIITYTTLFFK